MSIKEHEESWLGRSCEDNIAEPINRFCDRLARFQELCWNGAEGMPAVAFG